MIRSYPKLLLALLMIVATLSPIPYAHAGSYLSELEAEAKTLDAPPPQAATAEAKSNWSADKQTAVDALQPNLNRAGFEENLKFSFFGNYAIYNHLGSADKARVFQAYQEGMDIEALKALIGKLYKQM